MFSDQDSPKHQLLAELKEAREHIFQLERQLNRSTQNLSREYERFQHILNFFEKGPLIYQCLDEQGNILEVGQTWLEVLGFTREEVIGKNFGDFLPSKWRDHFKVYLPGFKVVGEIRNVEFEIVRKDGSVLPVSFNAHITRDEKEKYKVVHCVFQDIAELKRTEEALQQKTKEQALLLESVPVQIWYLTDIDTYGTVNRAHADFLGYSKQNLEYRPWKDFLHKDVGQAFRDSNIQVFGTKKSVHTHEWWYDAQGKQRLLDIIKKPKLDENNRVEYVICIGFEITEHKRREEKLLNCEEKYRQLINAIPIGIALVDENGKFLHSNPSIAERFNLTQQGLEGKTFQEIMPEEVANRRRKKGLEVIEKKETIYLEEERDSRYFQNYFVPVSTSGNTRTFQIISIEITELKQVEEKLKKNEKEYKQQRDYLENIFEKSGDAIAIIDSKGRITKWNKRASELLGYNFNEMYGKRCFDLYANKNEMEKMLDILRSRGCINEYEISIVDKQGTIKPCSISISILQGKNNRTIGSISIIRDLTEWKLAQQKLMPNLIGDYA
ncbi:hypothetical protein AKJ60_01295 [candidate division MSBL1 archaeon SCGC-AAA385M11]|nr:hypothetical protein AKJ60_01295 [candidate division MSBL1 archaeon SCGC-AAA385M11]